MRVRSLPGNEEPFHTTPGFPGQSVEVGVDSDVITLRFSPSGHRLVAFHRNGRLSSVDLESGAAVAIECGETSAAERAQNEVDIIDLEHRRHELRLDDRREVEESGAAARRAHRERRGYDSASRGARLAPPTGPLGCARVMITCLLARDLGEGEGFAPHARGGVARADGGRPA